MAISIRDATPSDLPRITEIYNHYVINTPITFDLEPVIAENRLEWFREHSDGCRYRMLVACDGEDILGYAGTGRFRAKRAYDTTVESTIYCAPEATGRGIGSALYAALFEAIADQDINRIVGGVTLPNEASVALHRRFGFRQIGIFTGVGRKFGRYWDVAWFERSLNVLGQSDRKL